MCYMCGEYRSVHHLPLMVVCIDLCLDCERRVVEHIQVMKIEMHKAFQRGYKARMEIMR